MVLVVSYSGAFGGAERLLLQFTAGFSDDVCLACPEGPLARAARGRGMTVLAIPFRPLHLRAAPGRAVAHLVAHAAEVRRLTRDLDPECVIAWGMRSALATLLGPRLGPPVLFQHNDLLPPPPVGALVRRAARRAQARIALSHTIARELGGEVDVVYPGVAVTAAGPPPGPPAPVLLLGAIAGWKRPDLALEAVALARRERPELRLRIVGAPLDELGQQLLERLRARAGEPDLAGAVEFAGAVAEPDGELARCACLLHCTPREPFGMVVLEALAAGRPAIVPAAAGPSEIVEEASGRLYAPGDAAAAARRLLELAEDPALARRLAEAGRERARGRFGLERAQREYAAVVERWRRRPANSAEAAGELLTLLTVTRNSAPELPGLLRSAARHLPGVRVVVVDCDSSDGTAGLARAAENADLLALGSNAGFGRACNVGLGALTTPVAVLVNPDAELVDGSLAELAAELAQAQAPERLLAPLVLLGDGRRQDSVHPLPASPADLLRSLIPPAAVPGRASAALWPWRAREPRPVGWAVGCALAARTDTLRRLGPFDERIFLYGEDLDLALRARAAGIETWFWPRARVIHHRARSSAREFGGEPFSLLARTRHEVVARQFGPRRARLDDAAQAMTFATRAALKRALGRDAARERRQLQVLRAARRG